MTSKEDLSETASYFDNIYRENADPWNFVHSVYEKEKRAASLAALPRPCYRSALEIGCSIGVFTRQLANHCEQLLAVDFSEEALRMAKERCYDLPQVCFALKCIPQEFPHDSFDLIILSEVGYYWSAPDLLLAKRRIIEHLEQGGHLLLVHSIDPAQPNSTADIHATF